MTQTSPGGFIRTEDQALTDTQALRFRSRGMTYQKIADAMGCTKMTAYNRVQRALAAIPAEAVDEYRRLETERLDAMLEITLDKALDPENKSALFAVDRALAIMDRRAKLLGLDSPVKHEVITLDYIQTEIMRLEATLGETDVDDNSEATTSTTQEA
jgi:DNA-binding Lrp family transcriptional regulator